MTLANILIAFGLLTVGAVGGIFIASLCHAAGKGDAHIK
jgi:hypothetical protein